MPGRQEPPATPLVDQPADEPPDRPADAEREAVHGAQAIRRAMAVLRDVAAAPDGVTAALTARRLALARTTVVRLLKALETEGLVMTDPATGRYLIGAGTLELAGRYLSRQDVRRIALPFLWQLAEQTRETVNLAIQDDLHSVCIEQIESPHAVRVVSWIGRRLPVHATATGKAWLAFQPAAVVDDVLRRSLDTSGRLPRFTAQTVADPEVLRRSIAEVRRRGYATTCEELETWLNAVAAPVFGHDDRVAAALVVSGPSFRLGAKRAAELGARIVATAEGISAALGYRRTREPTAPS